MRNFPASILFTITVLFGSFLTPAQSPALKKLIQKTDEYSKTGDAWLDKCNSGNCVNGKGERGYRNGDRYEGDFVRARKVGLGTYTFKNGDYYVGAFRNDKWNGAGKYYFAATNTFVEGIWANGVLVKATVAKTPADKCISGNCLSGKGKKVYANGDVYDGDFVKGRKEGQGTLTFKNGDVYVGQFSIDLFYQKGKMTYANGDTYDGAWAIGLREGQGTYTFKNGDTYVGEWLEDKRNGEGKFIANAINATQQGTWKDNVLVRPATATAKPAVTFEGGAKFDTPPNAPITPRSDIEQLIEEYKQAGFNQGSTLIGSGIYPNESSMQFNVSAGQTFVIVAITDYDPNTFGFYLRYNSGTAVVQTNDWNDSAYEISSSAQYAMKAETAKVRNLSVRRMNFSTTKRSSVRSFYMVMTAKSKVHWLCFRLK